MGNCLPALLVLVTILLASGCTTTAAEWNSRGEAYHATGQYGEAVAAFDQALALDPGYAEAWRNRGLSLALLGRPGDSEESFARAHALDPENARTYYYQALARNLTGDTQGALECLDHAVSLPPRDRDGAITLVDSLLFRGRILWEQGLYDEANASFARAHETMMGTI